MNEVWNLDVIYKGFDDPAFASDLEALKAQVTAFADLAQKLPAMEPAAGLKEGIRVQEEMNRLGMKLAEYAMLRQSANAADPEAGSNIGIAFSCSARLKFALIGETNNSATFLCSSSSSK